MQHHSGEHIVSGLAHARYGCDNVGFHMGADVITIDFNVELSWSRYRSWRRRPTAISGRIIRCRLHTPPGRSGSSWEYRSKKELTGRVRIVSSPERIPVPAAGPMSLLRDR